MNIQARKLNLIEEFLRISDDDIITKLENFLRIEKKIVYERELKPMALAEFHSMIDKSLQDSKDGNLILHDDFKKKIKTWQ